MRRFITILVASAVAANLCADVGATAERLRKNLLEIGKGPNFLWGHTIHEGEWNNADRLVRLRRETGLSPLVYSADFHALFGTFLSPERYAANRVALAAVIRREYDERHAVPVISWHFANPYTPPGWKSYSRDAQPFRYRYGVKGYRQKEPYPEEHRWVLREIVEGTGGECGAGRDDGSVNARTFPNPRAWYEWNLKEAAAFCRTLKDRKGRRIPLMFRFFHECECDWFWWGSGSSTPEDYIAAWRLTVDILRRELGRENVLFCYCAEKRWGTIGEEGKSGFLARYPGDDYIDVIGYDDYDLGEDWNVKDSRKHVSAARSTAAVTKRMRLISEEGERRGKICGIFECGILSAGAHHAGVDAFYSELLKVATAPGVKFAFIQTFVENWTYPHNEEGWADMRAVLKDPRIITDRSGVDLVAADMSGATVADVVDMQIGTGRATGSNVLGPCVPHGSAHPSPDSLWPSPHEKPKDARHGFGPPTSGWWPGDKVIGFSQLHAQGTGGVPSYGLFRYVCEPSDMEILEARPYCLRVRLFRADGAPLDVAVAPTAHGAMYDVRTVDGKPVQLSLNRRCKLAKDDCVNERGEFTGNWNPAPYRCYAHDETDGGLHRIAVSFKSDEQAREYFASELAGKAFDDIAASAKALWEASLSRIRIEGVDDVEKRRFYSHLAQTFIQPRDRTADGIWWDDHYTLWDTWRTLFPLMAIVDPDALAANVNAFADRFERNGRCDSCYTQGKDYKVGQGGDEADCVIADAWVKKVAGVDWTRVVPLLESRWSSRTLDYRERGFAVDGLAEGYCRRFKSGSATMNFAYQDWCCAEVLSGLCKSELAARFRERSGNWTNVWDGSAVDTPSGIRGFARARLADGSFTKTDPRKGFNTDFYEANCWEYSLFVPHDMAALVVRCGGKDAFRDRLSYALENGLVDFGNEPGFLVPWLFAYVGRGDLVAKGAREVAKLFAGDDLPGDNDSGAMSALYVFLKIGFFPVAGQDIYIMHGSAYPRIDILLPGGKTFVIRTTGSGDAIKSVTLNGHPHDPLFLRHSEIASGGELVFVK